MSGLLAARSRSSPERHREQGRPRDVLRAHARRVLHRRRRPHLARKSLVADRHRPMLFAGTAFALPLVLQSGGRAASRPARSASLLVEAGWPSNLGRPGPPRARRPLGSPRRRVGRRSSQARPWPAAVGGWGARRRARAGSPRAPGAHVAGRRAASAWTDAAVALDARARGAGTAPRSGRMRDVVDAGSACAARSASRPRPAARRTGTPRRCPTDADRGPDRPSMGRACRAGGRRPGTSPTGRRHDHGRRRRGGGRRAARRARTAAPGRRCATSRIDGLDERADLNARVRVESSLPPTRSSVPGQEHREDQAQRGDRREALFAPQPGPGGADAGDVALMPARPPARAASQQQVAVGLGDRPQLALEGQRPVLGRPLADVLELVLAPPRRDPVLLVEHDLRRASGTATDRRPACRACRARSACGPRTSRRVSAPSPRSARPSSGRRRSGRRAPSRAPEVGGAPSSR